MVGPLRFWSDKSVTHPCDILGWTHRAPADRPGTPAAGGRIVVMRPAGFARAGHVHAAKSPRAPGLPAGAPGHRFFVRRNNPTRDFRACHSPHLRERACGGVVSPASRAQGDWAVAIRGFLRRDAPQSPPGYSVASLRDATARRSAPQGRQTVAGGEAKQTPGCNGPCCPSPVRGDTERSTKMWGMTSTFVPGCERRPRVTARRQSEHQLQQRARC